MDSEKSAGKAVASSTFWQLASQVVMAALSIVTTKFVAIGLSVELAGHYNTAYGYLQLFGILADFGLYAVAVREMSKSKDRARTLGALLTLRICILLLSLGTALVTVWWNPIWQNSPLPLSVTIAAFVPFFTLLAGILRCVFQVEYRMHFVFIAEVLQRILTVSLTGIIIFFGVRGTTDPNILFMMLGIGGLGALLLFLLSLFFGRKIIHIKPSFDGTELWNILKLSAPYGFAFLCTALYRQFDVTLIAQLRPDFAYQNAAYGFVQRMMDMAYLIPTFLLNSTLPLLSEREARGEDTRKIVGTVFQAILLLGTTSALFAVMWSRPLTELLTTEKYLSAGLTPGSDTALEILSMSMFLNGLVLFCFYSMLTKNKWKPLIITLAIGVVISLALNLALIPRLGFVGASFTSVATHTVLAVLLLPQSMRILPMTFTLRMVLQWVAFAILLALGLHSLKPLLVDSINTALGLMMMTAWLGVCVWVTGLLKRGKRA